MSISISSFFLSKLGQTTVTSVIHRITINSVVIPALVDFGPISYDAREVVGGDFSVLADAVKTSAIQDLLSVDKSYFLKTSTFKFGFATEAGGEDLAEFFKGEFREARFSGGKIEARFKNLLYALSEKEIGSDDTPVDFTGSLYNPADLVWTLQSSYGLLSSIKSTSNPDVDYTSWLNWWNSLNGDNITVKAYFKGESVPTALEKIRDLTDSLIYEGPGNKLFYARWTGAASETHVVADSHILSDVEIIETADSIANKAIVKVDYNVLSNTWAGEVTRTNTPSVNSYGTHDVTFDDTNVWFTSSAVAINLADRIVYRRKEPNIQARVQVNFDFLDNTLEEIGENVEFSYGMYGIDRKQMTLLGMEFDFSRYTLILDLDEGFGFASGRAFGFILDDAYWGKLDQAYNPLF